MADLLTKQSMLQHSLERAKENFKKIGRANLNPTKIRIRIAVLKTNWAQYQEGHVGLLRSVAEASRNAIEYFRDGHFEDTEELFQSTLEYMNECLDELEPFVSPNQSLNTNVVRADSSALSFSQLPQIRLPPFDGNPAEWEIFCDRFKALIIQNKNLKDFFRMHYLASSLKGHALESICNIAITEENFDIAWRALISRFENKQRIISSHFSSLFELTGLTRESAVDLQALCDKVNFAVASLRGLNREPSDLWNDFLVHLVSQNLDPATRKAWNLRMSDAEDPPSYDELIRFLSSRVRALDDCNPPANARSPKTSTHRVHVATATPSAKLVCSLCRAQHYLSACSKFISQNPTQRRETVKRLKRCFNCLSVSHSVHECKSKYNCRYCQKRHHTMLHVESISVSKIVASPSCEVNSQSGATTTRDVVSLLASILRRPSAQILLATARVRIHASSGRSVIVRALVDQGSEATFISESLAQTLRAKRIRMHTAISAIGGTQFDTVKHAVDISISPRDSSNPSITTTALLLSSLTSYIPKRVTAFSQINHLKNLSWADPDPTGSDPIQIIISADLYGYIILEGIKKGEVGQPFAQNSILGWIISRVQSIPIIQSTQLTRTLRCIIVLVSLN